MKLKLGKTLTSVLVEKVQNQTGYESSRNVNTLVFNVFFLNSVTEILCFLFRFRHNVVKRMDSRESGADRSVEVCREFIRQRCKRSENECRYAHPPSHCHVINGRVTCCVDSIKV